MSETESLKGQFLNFSRPDPDARLMSFIDVILSHDLFEASIAIKMQLPGTALPSFGFIAY
jgi:hypothetical protein